MCTPFNTKFASVLTVSFMGCLPSLAGAALVDQTKPRPEVAAVQTAFTPYLQLHYQAESMLMMGIRPAVQANLGGLTCLPRSKAAKHG